MRRWKEEEREGGKKKAKWKVLYLTRSLKFTPLVLTKNSLPQKNFLFLHAPLFFFLFSSTCERKRERERERESRYGVPCGPSDVQTDERRERM